MLNKTSLGVKGLYFKLEDVIGQSISNGTVKTKLALVAFLYCREFVKNSIPCSKRILTVCDQESLSH